MAFKAQGKLYDLTKLITTRRRIADAEQRRCPDKHGCQTDPPKRSRARQQKQTQVHLKDDSDFRRDPVQTYKPTIDQTPFEIDLTAVMIKQPETRPISQEQLVAEVKGIYAGLVMMASGHSRADTEKKMENLSKSKWHSETRSSTPKQQNGPLVARGHIDGREVNALADTGAGYNIVHANFARYLGWESLSRKHDKGEKLRMANGSFIDTIGAFEAVWRFASDPSKSWKITFHVVRNLIHDAVLGKDFLMGSGTMTKHRHRLSRLKRVFRTLQGLPLLFVNNIGTVTQRLQGLIIGDAVEALPDSGSEPNLLSLDYVVRRGMRDLINTNDIRMVQFADGTVQKTMGSLWANWAYASSSADEGEWSEHFVEFHVLRGCAYDAIIGQDVLEDTDAFTTHEGSFIDIYVESEPSGLNLLGSEGSLRTRTTEYGGNILQGQAEDTSATPLAFATFGYKSGCNNAVAGSRA
ncbi:LOW QUALITY PROTEIN: hypothetical protein Ct61P_09851 [Colletotrichum tofieldiae]|nr:LOW QUALITY PROTEIN: hypothetical protein Ct61P_09851 [Colletotrichum tofieldiae]